VVRADGAFAAVAHPRGGRKAWKGGLPPSAAAIEVVNGDVAWRDDRGRELTRAFLFYPFDAPSSLASLVDPPRPALAWWDSLLAARLVLGLAGLDAHGGVRSGRLSLPLPSYRAVLSLAHQHLWIAGSLPADADEATRMLLDALRAGRHFLAFDCFGPARGFAVWGSAAGRTAVGGDSLALAPGAMIHARVPRDPRIVVRLVHAGVVINETRGWEAEFPVREPGVYRVEVYQRRNTPFGESLEIPWIFSNPIRVTP
jgi:hypothetical protein